MDTSHFHTLTGTELSKLHGSGQQQQDAKKIAFLKSLLEETTEWEKCFIAFVETKARELAVNSFRRSYNVATPWRFDTKFRDKFRVSTFVTQYKFDKAYFEEIGYTLMPFEKVVAQFASRGITIENISTSSRGYHFWVRISF